VLLLRCRVASVPISLSGEFRLVVKHIIVIRTNLNKLKAYIIVAVKLTSELNILLITL